MMTPEQAYERFRKIVKYEARHVAYASQGLELIPLDERKQDAWVRILSRLPQIETKKNAEAYVRTLVRNAIRNTARKIYFADGEGFTVRERGATDHNFWPCTLSGPSMRETGAPIRPSLCRISGSGVLSGFQPSGASSTATATPRNS